MVTLAQVACFVYVLAVFIFNAGARGVGVRNHIVIIGTTSLTASYVRQLASRFKSQRSDTFDGVTCVAHTEGAIPGEFAHNTELLLRCLSGFVVHSNVGAALIVDYNIEAENVTGRRLLQYMTENGYPVNDVKHQFLTLCMVMHIEGAYFVCSG